MIIVKIIKQLNQKNSENNIKFLNGWQKATYCLIKLLLAFNHMVHTYSNTNEILLSDLWHMLLPAHGSTWYLYLYWLQKYRLLYTFALDIGDSFVISCLKSVTSCLKW